MIHATAIVKSKIPESCVIHPYVVIGENVVLGGNCVIHSFVVISDHCEIAKNVEIFPGAYIGKEPKNTGALTHQPRFKRKLKIDSDCSIGPHAVIYYDVEISHNTLIGDGASIREQCVIGSKVIIGRYVTLNYDVKIGNRTKIMDHTWLAGNMEVGEDVFISGGVMTANDNNIGLAEYADHLTGPNIANRSRIGIGAIILPNVTIEQNSLVAAGSVVTKDVVANSSVKGMPARGY